MGQEPLDIATDFPPLSVEDWRAQVERDLKGARFESLRTGLPGGIALDPLYTRADAEGDDAIGFPGLPPFVRGGAPLGPSSTGWSITQEYDDPRMDVAAEAIGRDLARGGEGVWLRLGTDHGVRVLTAGDLDRVLKHVDLARVPVFLEAGTDAFAVGGALVAVAEARGVPTADLRGCLGVDPYGTLARQGSLPSGFEGAYRALGEMAAWTAKHAPGMRSCLVSSAPFHDAGASAVQELAWAMAEAVAYLRKMVEAADLDVETAARQILFAFPVSGDFFSEIAKLRAARLLWSKVVAASGGSPAAQAMRMHARTSAFTKTKRDPWVNMLRATAEGFAAAVGGADTIATTPFDAAVGPSDDFARRVARNAQIVLRAEAHLHRVIDPAGGSWFLESLTDQLARAAWSELQAIEQDGGLGKAIARGRIARAIETTANERQRMIATRKTAVVGVNEFPNLGEQRVARPSVDLREVEVELGNTFGAASAEARFEGLERFASIARSTKTDAGDVFAAGVDMARLSADFLTLQKLLDEGYPSLYAEPIAPWRMASGWESLRDQSDAFRDRTGALPRVFLANLGPVAEHKARATWITNLLAAGGIEAIANDGFESAEAVAGAFRASGSKVAVICGTDARYAELAAPVAKALVGAGAEAVVLAGRPGDAEERYREGGVSRFAFAGGDGLSLLHNLHVTLGVSS